MDSLAVWGGMRGVWLGLELKRSPPVLGEVVLYMCVGVGVGVGVGMGVGSDIKTVTMTVLGSYASEVEIEVVVEVRELVSAGRARVEVGSGTSSLTSAIGTAVGNAAAEVNATVAKNMKPLLSAVIENGRRGIVADSREFRVDR